MTWFLARKWQTTSQASMYDEYVKLVAPRQELLAFGKYGLVAIEDLMYSKFNAQRLVQSKRSRFGVAGVCVRLTLSQLGPQNIWVPWDCYIGRCSEETPKVGSQPQRGGSYRLLSHPFAFGNLLRESMRAEGEWTCITYCLSRDPQARRLHVGRRLIAIKSRDFRPKTLDRAEVVSVGTKKFTI